jgi:hypothetical protein
MVIHDTEYDLTYQSDFDEKMAEARRRQTVKT